MSIQDEWLGQFKAIVTHEIQQAGGRKSDGYRAVEAKTGLGYDYIYQIYNGKPEGRPKRPSAEAMNSLLAAYGSMHPALAPEVISDVAPALALRASRQIAVVGEVKGGDHGYLEELQYPVGHGEGTVDFPTADPLAYALRVRGDSMHPRYRAGEFVVVEPSVEALPGDDVVVALYDGRKLLKELGWRRDGEVQLLSVNNHFGPMTLECAQIATMQLVAGRVRRGAINK